MAYILGLFEVSLTKDTNHLGFCVFDEPGQQKINDNALKEFYNKLISMNFKQGQIFIATSENLEVQIKSSESSTKIFSYYFLKVF